LAKLFGWRCKVIKAEGFITQDGPRKAPEEHHGIENWETVKMFLIRVNKIICSAGSRMSWYSPVLLLTARQ